MHYARHTYAVRAIRARAPFEVVRKQLGHKNTTMVIRVYGRFEPREDEMRNWEARAAVLDQEAASR
jgi:integrase